MRVPLTSVRIEVPPGEARAYLRDRLRKGGLVFPAEIDLRVSPQVEARLGSLGPFIEVTLYNPAHRPISPGAPPVGPLYLSLKLRSRVGDVAEVEALQRDLKGVLSPVAEAAWAASRVPFTVASVIHEQSWRNQGLGTALYVALAEVVGRVGGGITPETSAGGTTSMTAQAVWQKLKDVLHCELDEWGRPLLCWPRDNATTHSPEVLALVEEAYRLGKRKVEQLNIHDHGACLVYAAAVVTVAQKHGIRLVLQAGTALWPRVRPEQDDGVSSTHFGYEWEPSRVAFHLANGNMPEMHVWAGNPATQELVDLTTGHFPAQCKALLGEDWPGDRPPEFYWGPGRDLPTGVVYRPNADATRLAVKLLTEATSR